MHELQTTVRTDDDPRGAERRRSARREVALQVRLTPASSPDGSGAFTYISRDLSEGGVSIRCSRPLAKDERVRLRFALPKGAAMVELDAVVAWTRRGEGGGEVGLRFARMAPADADALARFAREDDSVRRTLQPPPAVSQVRVRR